MEEPSLAREIGKVAWLATKVVGGLAVLLATLFLLFQKNPLLGLYICVGLVLIGQVILVGWSSYKSKKKEFEWRKRDEQRDQEWKAAEARRENSA